MVVTWRTLIIRAPNPNIAQEFRELSRRRGAIPAAEMLDLNVKEKTLTVQRGASLTLRQNLQRMCDTDTSIVWCSLQGPRAAFYIVKG